MWFVLVIHGCITQTTNILSHSICGSRWLNCGQWPNWVLWLRISHKATIKVFEPSQGLTWTGSTSSSHKWLLAGFMSPKPTVWRSPSVPLPSFLWGSSQHSSWFHHSKQAREQEKVNKTAARVISWPNLRLTSHHSCHILLVRSKSEVLPTLQRSAFHNGKDEREPGSLRTILEAMYHTVDLYLVAKKYS